MNNRYWKVFPNSWPTNTGLREELAKMQTKLDEARKIGGAYKERLAAIEKAFPSLSTVESKAQESVPVEASTGRTGLQG